MKVDRLRQAYVAISAVPAADFDLNYYYCARSKSGCALGWLARMGLFDLTLDERIPMETNSGLHEIPAACGAFKLTLQQASVLFSTSLDYHQGEHKAVWLRRMEQFAMEHGFSLAEVATAEAVAA